jgi:hypothetical protein
MHSNWLGNLAVPITDCVAVVSCFIMIGPDGHEKPIKAQTPFSFRLIRRSKNPRVFFFCLCEKRKIVSTEQLRERELCGRQMAAF